MTHLRLAGAVCLSARERGVQAQVLLSRAADSIYYQKRVNVGVAGRVGFMV